MKFDLINGKIKVMLLYLTAFVLLFYSYARIITPIFGADEFEWLPNNLKLFESFFILIIFSLILPSKIRKPSDFFVHLHFLLPVLPMLAIYSAMDRPRSYMYFVLISFALLCYVRKLKIPTIRGEIISIDMMEKTLLIIVAVYVSSIIVFGGLRYLNFDLLKVYDFRYLSAQNLPKIYNYFSPMASKILLPMIMVLAVYRRQWSIGILAFSGSFMMFGLTNHKGPLFYPIICVGLYYCLHSQQRRILSLLIGTYALVVLVCILSVLLAREFSSVIVSSLILRRGYFVPARLNFIYYDFFSTHPHTFLAESKLTAGLIGYPYDLKSSTLIGYLYFHGGLEGGANTGWLGSAYMNFGFAGMLLYATVIGLLFGVIDMVAKRREAFLPAALLSIPFLTLFLSSDLPTAMLNHGLFLGIFLTWSCRLRTSKT